MPAFPSVGGLRARLGMTEGQAWTAALGVVFALGTSVVGLPPILDARQSAPPPSSLGMAVHDPEVAASHLGSPSVLGSTAAASTPQPPTWAEPRLDELSLDEPPRTTSAAGESETASQARPDGGESSTSPPTPLQVIDGGWVSAAGGTPAASTGLREDDYPVSWFAGRPDKQAFLRIAGSATTLSLSINAEPTATYFAHAAVVWACPITVANWHVGDGAPTASAPAWSCDRYAVGGPSQDASGWAFDLSSFHDVALDNGVTLVAQAPSSGASYQVAFASPPSTPSRDQ